MKILIVDIDEAIVDAARRELGALEGFEVRQGSILDAGCDAVVSPANSFGFMDGGIDLVYSERFGWDLQRALQQRIMDRHHGELLVGEADIVETEDASIPYLIAAPTMRVPSNIEETTNAYLAMRAVLLLVKHGSLDDGRRIRDAVKTVAMPGLGTGIGRMPPKKCARQMRQAWEDVRLGVGAFPTTCRDAWKRHERLVAGLMSRR